MKDNAKDKFVRTWGEMASCWGINKTMARIHALLIAADAALSTDEIMERLEISRGNANMNLRALVDWGLIRRVSVGSERREYFQADQDIWSMGCRIARERKKREIEPVIVALEECLKESGDPRFNKKISELLELVKTVDSVLGRLARQERSTVMPKVLAVLKTMA
ncbi:MAG: helix-turn-helix domain-containing protein [Elusimicrobia bacterium]|nr:helix-turn-helix domain-containing protein [Elusimicrobiota bacterium]